MPSSNSISVFDLIGPVMVGPSSSHTAGAVRLGNIARSVLGSQPQKALLELHGSFAETGAGHGTDKALVAGLLGFPPDDERIPGAFDEAKRSGLLYQFQTVDLGEEAHPNAVRLTLQAGENKLSLVGASIGGGQVLVTDIQGYRVKFSGAYDTLLVIAEDQPGTINSITGWLLSQNINVAFLRVGRQRRGREAIMVIETDHAIPDHVVEELSHFSWVVWVRLVHRIE